MSSLIKIQNVSKIYKQGNEIFKALSNVSLDIHSGEFVSLVGTSGSGKSTILNIIGLLDSPTIGEYLVDGINVKKLSKNKLAKIRSNSIGFVFQQFILLPKYNAVQNVCLPLLYQGYTQSQAQSKAKSILDKVGMSSKYFSKPNELSGGQQQRVAIARALVASAKIILADEPTGSLDSKTGDGIISLLKDLNEEGKTIILVTHDNSIANNCPRVIKLNDGRVV